MVDYECVLSRSENRFSTHPCLIDDQGSGQNIGLRVGSRGHMFLSWILNSLGVGVFLGACNIVSQT